jgi:hypothetical protein
MGKITGFLELDRTDRAYQPAAERTKNFKEFVVREEAGVALHGLRHSVLP